MLFVSGVFAVFFAVVYLGHTLLHGRNRAWQWWMLAASWVFYAWWDVRLIWVLIGVCLATWAGGLWVEAVRVRATGTPAGVDQPDTTYAITDTPERALRVPRHAIAVSVAGVIAVMAACRYVPFLTSTWNTLVPDSWELVALQLPVVLGISFVGFEAISYLVDVHRGEAANRSVREVALFLSFFPHLAAGPILRARDFFSQMRDRERPANLALGTAGAFILAGLVKKVVLTEVLIASMAPVRQAPDAYSALDVLVTVLAGPLRIFCDVSAYSDIAIGLAMLLGVRFPENFRKPFAAASLMEFWHRWHMTVTGFFRDYVYEPLRGQRRGGRMALAALATFAVSGLWHGPTWAFVLWGLLQGVAVVCEAAWRMRRLAQRRRRRKGRGIRVAKIAGTYGFVAVTGLLFSGLSIGASGEMLGRLATGSWTSSAVLTWGFVLVAGAVVVSQFTPPHWGKGLQERVSTWPAPAQGALFAVLATVVLACGGTTVSMFVYYRF